MREPTRQCGVENCPKGGTHKEPYLATACRLYDQFYNHGKRKLTNAFAAVGETPHRAIEITGTSKGWIQLAKELKIRCYRRMSRTELEEAVACVKEGRQDRLGEIEQVARERGRAAWEAWRAGRANGGA